MPAPPLPNHFTGARLGQIVCLRPGERLCSVTRPENAQVAAYKRAAWLHQPRPQPAHQQGYVVVLDRVES